MNTALQTKIPLWKVGFIGFQTIVINEIIRFTRIWQQTLLPSVITISLYFIIFGRLIGSELQNIHGVSYMQFIAPGLIMMAVINNSYGNVVASFYGMRFQNSIDEILISPIPDALIVLGFVIGGMLRGIIVGILVSTIALCFTHLYVHNVRLTILVVILTSALFSLLGFLNAMYAKNFDDINFVPTFILLPLIYLGGVFYSISQLPPVWYTISRLNPIYYIIDAFRFGILGIHDVFLGYSLIIIAALIVILFYLILHLLQKGIGTRT